MQTLPSRFQIGDEVKHCVMPKGFDGDSFPGIPAEVIAVHFYAGKVKYDLEFSFEDDTCTRIYNVDSVFVLPRVTGDAEVIQE